MNGADRFRNLRKKLRQKLGAPTVSGEVDRELSLAASIQLTLENSRHEALLGRKFDPAVLAALREQLGVALLAATIAMQKRKTA